MNRRSSILCLRPGEPVLLRIAGDASVSRQSLAAGNANDLALAIKEALRAQGDPHASLILALDDEACFAVPMQHEGKQHRQSHEEKLFAIEPRLPWAVEEIVADYIEGVSGTSLAIVALQSLLQEQIEELEKLDIPVDAIVPESLLGFQGLLQETKVDGIVLWQTHVRIHCFLVRNQRLMQWFLVDGVEEIWPLLASLRQSEPQAPISALGLSDDEIASLGQRVGLPFTALHCDADPDSWMAKSAVQLARGKIAPIVNLRTGQLAALDPWRNLRTPIQWASASLIILLIACACAMFIRAWQYDRLAQQSLDSQQVLFSRLYPNQVAPLDVSGRLRSEHRRLLGISGEGSDFAPPRSGLALLESILAALPLETRFRLYELRIENDKIYLEGETRSHGDAETIAASMRQNSPLSVESPRSENRASGGVSFTLNASMPQTKEVRP